MSGNNFIPNPTSKRRLDGDSDNDVRLDFAKRQRTSREGYGRHQGNDQGGPSARLPHSKYTVGWICALHIEMAAGHAMLDRTHESLPTTASDTNAYTLGNVGRHNIVMACLPAGQYGTNNAAIVASNMVRSFPSIRVGLMVGIGGGVPGDVDIRLGDIVVGSRVIQYDLGKIVPGDRVERTGTVRVPPQVALNAISRLRALHETTAGEIPSILQDMHERYPSMAEYAYPRSCEDRLFRATYDHDQSADCSQCSPSQLQYRPSRTSLDPRIHYGGIASGNQVVKCARTRDTLAKELDIICFEMEAAGLVDSLPCVVIRGICDYADSHKNKQWQRYAAATAAAYAKELLSNITPSGSSGVPVTHSPVPCLEDVQEKLQARRIDFLESLRFEQIDSRHATIKTAHSKTCEWLLQDLTYKMWLDPSKALQHHGFLWVSGKPGAGKSTIMKFVFNRARKNLKADAAIASFFFNARGDDLEKSTIGLHRSLLLQLLERFPDVQTVLDDSSLIPLHKTDCPSIEILRDLFRNAVLALGHRHLTCFVDALDECDEEQVREMVTYFEELGDQATAENIKLKICFSSRHYPHINIQNGLRLNLEDQPGHEKDLETYVLSRLRAGSSLYADKIRNQILEKAAGVFMWVVLVVDLLNKEINSGRLYAVERRLQEIPSRLGELFKDILRRDNDNMDELLLSILWILFAKRPLNRKEYYLAILSGLPECDDAFVAYDPAINTDDTMGLYVTSSSKGLAEITKSGSRNKSESAKSGTVQFIHESVRDFLIKDNGLKELWPGLGDDFQSLSHERLKQCCYSYMTRNISGPVPSPDALPKANSEQARELRQKASEQLPFLEYSTENVLHHANMAAEGVPEDAFLDHFPLKGWIYLNNILEKHQVRRYTQTATLAYVLADKNFPNLLNIDARNHPNIHLRGERYGFPFFAALANGHWLAAKTILGQGASHLSDEDLFPAIDYNKEFDSSKGLRSNPLTWALDNEHSILFRLLISSIHVDCTVKATTGCTAMHEAAITGNLTLMTTLVKKVFDFSEDEIVETSHTNSSNRLTERGIGFINMADTFGMTSLYFAAENGHEACARMLLDLGADVESPSYSRSPLSVAAKNGHEAIVHLLIKNGAIINTDSEQTPLHLAARNGHEAIVRLLIEKEAIINTNNAQQTPLHLAAQNGYEAIVRLLIENGAIINTNNTHKTPLHLAAQNGYEAIVRLLIENKAVVDWGNKEETLLPDALHGGGEAIAKLLIDNGADVQLSTKHKTALHVAAAKGSPNMVRLLLQKGAPVNQANEPRTGTALHAAIISGGSRPVSDDRKSVIKLLLEYGESVRLRGDLDRTPLHLVARIGDEALVSTFLQNGADVDSIDLLGQTPLHLAARDGHVAVVSMLVENGASTHLADAFGKLPINWAIDDGRVETAKVLSLLDSDLFRPNHGPSKLLSAGVDGDGYGQSAGNSFGENGNGVTGTNNGNIDQAFAIDDVVDYASRLSFVPEPQPD